MSLLLKGVSASIRHQLKIEIDMINGLLIFENRSARFKRIAGRAKMQRQFEKAPRTATRD